MRLRRVFFECAARPFEFVVICVAFALPLCPVMSLKCVLLGFVHCSASPLGDRVLAAVSAKVSAAGPGVADEAVGVALARVLSDEGLHDNEAMCDRDYSVPCPEGWVDRGDGGSCSPPIGYVGPCSEVDLRGLPPLTTSWGCRSTCATLLLAHWGRLHERAAARNERPGCQDKKLKRHPPRG